MKFGFHTQMNNWQHQATHTQMLDDIREQVQLCEQLGFDAVWLPEHHLNPEGLGVAADPVTPCLSMLKLTRETQTPIGNYSPRLSTPW